MGRRVGIELGPSHCRVVEVESGGGAWRRSVSKTSRVRTFASIPYGTLNPIGLAGALRPLISRRTVSRRVSVAAWGLRSSHHYLLLPPADPSDLVDLARREAKRAAPGAVESEPTDGVLVGGVRELAGLGGQREVTYVSTSAGDVRNRLQPLVDAGFSVEAVVTPAVALAAVARLRSAGAPDEVHAYVAIEADVTALSVVRNGLVLFGRELPWGYASDRQADHREFATRLAAELRRSFTYVKQHLRVDVQRAALCGGFSDLRTLTAPLLEALNLEVEVLDLPESVDVTAPPEPAEEFRTKVAELRMAWAVAADEPSLNLMPREVRSQAALRQEQYRMAAGVAAGLLIGAAGVLATTMLVKSAEADVRALRQQVAALEPRLRQIEARRQEQLVSRARRAALDAFATQGPRLARVLEVLDRATPGDVVIQTLQIKPKGAVWRLVLTGESLAANSAQAQVSFNQFLRAAQSSALVGAPVQPPILKVNSGEPGVAAVEARERTASAALVGAGDIHDLAAGLGATGESVGAPGVPLPGDPAYEAYRQQLLQVEEAELQRRRRPFEEHWLRHPVKPIEYYQWLEEDRAYREAGARLGARVAGQPAGPPGAPATPMAVLAFTVEFEVRK